MRKDVENQIHMIGGEILNKSEICDLTTLRFVEDKSNILFVGLFAC